MVRSAKQVTRKPFETILNEKVTKFGKVLMKNIHNIINKLIFFNETNIKINKANSKQIFQTL